MRGTKGPIPFFGCYFPSSSTKDLELLTPLSPEVGQKIRSKEEKKRQGYYIRLVNPKLLTKGEGKAEAGLEGL